MNKTTALHTDLPVNAPVNGGDDHGNEASTDGSKAGGSATNPLSNRGGGGSEVSAGPDTSIDNDGKILLPNGPSSPGIDEPVAGDDNQTNKNLKGSQGVITAPSPPPDSSEKKEVGLGVEWVKESDLPERYGLTRPVVAGVRTRFMAETVHWKKEGREILLNAAGLALFEEKIGIEKKEAAPVKEVVELKVVKVPRNPKMLLAGTLDGARKDLRVRVKNNKNFKPGMKLVGCTAVDAEKGYYELKGKPPRRPGKW